MKVLSIDPGLKNLGYAILEKISDDDFKIHDYNSISSEFKSNFLAKKLCNIHKKVSKLISIHNPDHIAIEKIIYKHTRSTLILAKVQGVLIFTFESQSKPIYEYTPLQVKKWVTGYGHAKKDAVKKMIQNILHMDKIETEKDLLFDPFDALAIGLCHLIRYSSNEELSLKSKI